MNREILFKAKRKDNNEWVYGYYMQDGLNNSYIIELKQKGDFDYSIGRTYRYIEVIPETVSQYTGLDDMNGKKIFENDIVRDIDDDIYYIVSFSYSAFDLLNLRGNHSWFLHDWNVHDFLEVMGNKFDNPELLEKEVKE